MKKIVFMAAAIALSFVTLSCATNKEYTQDEVNTAFEKVYDKYVSSLILDGAKTYQVVEKDTLSAITVKYYGSDKGYYFPVIMLASSDVVLDPDLIKPGMKLTVPDLQKNLDNPASRAKMKSFFKEIATVYQKKGNLFIRDKLNEIADSL
ncbi:LysM peptidoglycan-binding domain-containing protein [Brucepastera parasyntrophica]|uniref:LysM peptidoglycan-binding domain-containing protein n=1 Tax=Brucepastera parasyntrophica TaxID=2880008 RepID=UPI002109DABB|nr:LysM peptidoglycan-binding domain-containing protein [Brucepastera parasyntrophica]ULQ60833.1 LysM peptidoglycan-binding domain-containing protein [Brucepastera parasyntrophica]